MEDTVRDIIDYCRETVKPSKKIEKLIEECKAKEIGTFQRFATLFNDSIHGSIEVNSLEKEIINSEEFFRLKNIKQLGGKFHVYPGATHTRFEHSIGVCHLAGEFIEHLNKQEVVKISKKEERCVRLAGLCHDLGHGPFSHLFESVTEDVLCKGKLHHEELSKLIFKKILLDNPTVLARFVGTGCEMTVKEVKMIEMMIVPGDFTQKELDEEIKDPKKRFLYEIVANKESGMDVDKWDYFARDFLHLGVTNEFDWKRCMKMSSVVKSDRNSEYHIGFRDKEIVNVYGMFRTRSILYLKALMHKTVEAIEMMIADILRLAKEVKLNIDGQPISLMEALQQAYLDKPASLNGYIALTDSILSLIMLSPSPASSEDLKKAQKLIERLQKRCLYKCVEEKTIDFHEQKILEGGIREFKEWTNKIREFLKKCSNEDWKIMLVCFKFSSEDQPNPVKDEIYFFPKKGEANEEGIPIGQKEGVKGIQTASPLCKPEQYIELRVRMYKKKAESCLDESKRQKYFEECLEAIKLKNYESVPLLTEF